MEGADRPERRLLKRSAAHAVEPFQQRAVELAVDSHARTRHAVVVISQDSLVGWGVNGVPLPGEDHCYCKVELFGDHDHCRAHAEQRAIALAREGVGWDLLRGAQLLYVRLDREGETRLEEPHFCARCSRLALSLGVDEWVFPLPEGLVAYSAADYDRLAALLW